MSHVQDSFIDIDTHLESAQFDSFKYTAAGAVTGQDGGVPCYPNEGY